MNDTTLTVNQLYKFCKHQIDKGNGDKKILITSDDEGNGYHGLYYEFCDDIDEIKQVYDFCFTPEESNPEDVILLG